MHYSEYLSALGGLRELSSLRQGPWRDGRLFGTSLDIAGEREQGRGSRAGLHEGILSDFQTLFYPSGAEKLESHLA